MKLMNALLAAVVGASMLAGGPAMASTEEEVAAIQHAWERVKYQAPPADQEKEFEHLVKEADQLVARNPQRAEALIWHGIIEGSYAGAKGGFGALAHAKNARKDFESALKLDPKALNGSAYTSLGSLYYQVPGWPIGFGDDKKAEQYLKQGLALNPDGIDPNFFYGDFLYRNGDLDNAESALRKALRAPDRPGRKLADEGRRAEIKQLLEKIAAARKNPN